MNKRLQSPFPYFGSKSAVADLVWESLGNVNHYIEPFFGSGAVLLARPGYDPQKHTETICDSDGFICNVWRSLQFSPDETARWCDWPVNHADLSARKKALIKNESRLLENLASDDKWHDPAMAGYWVWAASCWIGSGLTRIGQIPHVGSAGMGVKDPYNTNIYAWFRELSERLRHVRVVSGDWTRVCGGNWQDNMGIVGIYFDPPYGVEDRDTTIYHHDSTDVANDVRTWCIERGKIETYRIVLSGYDEHDELENHGWTKKNWIARGGYANQGNSQGRENRRRETLWFSPYCLKTELF